MITTFHTRHNADAALRYIYGFKSIGGTQKETNIISQTRARDSLRADNRR